MGWQACQLWTEENRGRKLTMFKYPKIETLFKRDEKFKITNEIRLPEFENIKKWLITEKIDGTNIRVIFDKTKDDYLVFKGRTDNAQIPTFLYEALLKMFPIEKFVELFSRAKEVCLYGEGYGAKIQKGGGNYNKGNSFRLFDVWIDGWWLKQKDIIEIAKQLEIKTAPVLGIMSIKEIIELVKKGFSSAVAKEEGTECIAEGIVATSHPLVLFKNRNPLKFKLKVSDYK